MARPLSAEEPVATALTEYEKQRLENVKRNQAMIAALGIQNAKAEMQLNGSKRQEVQGYRRSTDKRVRERDEPVVTRRLRSSRVSWTDEDLLELQNPPSPEPDKKILTLENNRKPLSLSAACVSGSSTDSLITCLQDLDEHTPLSGTPTRKKAADWDIDPSQYSLHQGDIARVVPERIMSVSFLPVSDRLMIVAGDKGGHLGFWDVERADTEGGGVHVFQPHLAPVSGIAIASNSASKIFTCSYDGTVKQLDTETSMFDIKYCVEEDYIFSAICSVPGNPFCVYIGEQAGFLKMLDTREKAPTFNIQIHQKRINTIDVNAHSPWQMVTSSTDTKVRVWDIRKMRNDRDKIGAIQHQKGVTSAEFSPSGSSVVSCSYDNTVAVLKVNSKSLRYIAHPNTNNRWISTFRAIWGWDDEYIYVGNMKRTIDIISTKFEIECHWLSSPLMSSIPCRLAAHPLQQGILAGCSAGGQIFIWRQ